MTALEDMQKRINDANERMDKISEVQVEIEQKLLLIIKILEGKDE